MSRARGAIQRRSIWRQRLRDKTRYRPTMSANFLHGIAGAAWLLLASECIPAEETSQPTYEWEQITLNAPFAPRDGAGALSFAGRMWLLGGWNPGQTHREFFPLICNNEVWSSADGTNWMLVKPNTFKDRSFDPTSDWEGRHTAGYAVY